MCMCVSASILFSGNASMRAIGELTSILSDNGDDTDKSKQSKSGVDSSGYDEFNDDGVEYVGSGCEVSGSTTSNKGVHIGGKQELIISGKCMRNPNCKKAQGHVGACLLSRNANSSSSPTPRKRKRIDYTENI